MEQPQEVTDTVVGCAFSIILIAIMILVLARFIAILGAVVVFIVLALR